MPDILALFYAQEATVDIMTRLESYYDHLFGRIEFLFILMIAVAAIVVAVVGIFVGWLIPRHARQKANELAQKVQSLENKADGVIRDVDTLRGLIRDEVRWASGNLRFQLALNMEMDAAVLQFLIAAAEIAECRERGQWGIVDRALNAANFWIDDLMDGPIEIEEYMDERIRTDPDDPPYGEQLFSWLDCLTKALKEAGKLERFAPKLTEVRGKIEAWAQADREAPLKKKTAKA